MKRLLSVVIPVYNESANLAQIHAKLTAVLGATNYDYEFVFVNDGSTDGSAHAIDDLAQKDERVKFVEFSRNFGKEAATSAGIEAAKGDAVIIIDADLQHPPEMIPEFIRQWEGGAEVVVGVRQARKSEGVVRRMGGSGFTGIMNAIGDTPAPRGSTDFRLIDRKVADAFGKLTEHKRLTRSLIDWLGFKRVYVPFVAAERGGKGNRYSYGKLFGTAFSAIIAHSRVPLLLAGYLGVFITVLSAVLGLFVIIEQLVLGDPLGIQVSGTAMLAILILFLNGITLICLGLVAAYVGTIQEETARRPLYVVRRKSAGA